MLTLEELRAKLQKALDDGDRIVVHAKGEGRANLTPHEDADLQEILAEVRASKSLIELAESRQTMEDDQAADDARSLAEAEANRKRAGVTGGPMTADDIYGPDNAHRRSVPNGKRYRDMFPEAKGSGGFKNFEEFLSVVHSGLGDRRLQPAAMTEGIGSEGGFLVPPDFAAEMLDEALETEIVRRRATVWPMKSAQRTVPGWDGTNHSSTLYGGIAGQWLGEGENAGADTNPKTRAIVLNARTLACYAGASIELVQDGMTFDELLGGALTGAVGYFLDHAFISGNGAGKPLGMLSDPALITVNKETNQPADTIQYENLCKMLARLHPASVNNSIWLANPTVIPQLLTMGITLGVGGAPIWTQNPDGSFSLLTRPVVFTEKVPALGDKSDISLVDFGQYAVGLRRDISIDRSNAPGWRTREESYRVIVRADGMGKWAGPVTPTNGDTLSWCVTLEARV